EAQFAREILTQVEIDLVFKRPRSGVSAERRILYRPVSGALPRRHYDRRLRVSGLSRLGLQGGLTHANQFYERRVVRCGQVSQNLAVQSDLSGLEALYEPAVSRPGGTGGRVDADQPQAAEIALLGATVAERVLPPMINGVRRVAIEFRAAHPKALGGSEHS